MITLENYRYDAERCPKCNNCKWVDFIYTQSHRFAKICPSIARFNFEAYAAHGRFHLALSLMDGKLDFSPQFLDVIYKCNLCGGCDVRCKVVRDHFLSIEN